MLKKPPDDYLPAPDGNCWCGCEGKTTGGYFMPGHDRSAEARLLKSLYGDKHTIARFLWAHGYGPPNYPSPKNRGS